MFGLLNIDKPAGLTSRDVVNRVQRLVRPDKVGHAGTLDPLATGVLVLAVGPATRLIEYVRAGAIDPTAILSRTEPLVDVIAAYEQFDRRQPGWLKVMLAPVGQGA